MRHAAALAAILVSLPAAAHDAPRWTFCVAATRGGAEVWISDVFAAEGSRERLEGAFKGAIERLGASRADVQCPEPRDDKTVAVNAQFDAEAFNRKMGAILHAVPPSDVPGRAVRRRRRKSRCGEARRPKRDDDLPVGSNRKPHRAEQ